MVLTGGKSIKKLVKVFLIFILIFLIAELYLRSFPCVPQAVPKQLMIFSTDKGFRIFNGVIPRDHFLFERDPYLFWKLKHVSSDVFHAINKQGFRGEVIPMLKPKGVFRIFCIGDSCAFGNALQHTQAYPFYLEGLLKRPGNKVAYEVVNAGVPGYSSLQGLRHLQRDILPYQPDLVIASFGWNDTWPAVFYTDKEQRSPSYLSSAIYRTLQHSLVFVYLENIISVGMVKMRTSHIKNNTKIEQRGRVPEDDFVENLTAIETLGRKKHFKVIFLNQPARQFITHRYDSLIRKVSENTKAYFIDLLPAFRSSGHIIEDLFLDDNHYSPLGNQIIAQRIFDFLKEKKIVE
jgi:lysophospholipase L1-like esterase